MASGTEIVVAEDELLIGLGLEEALSEAGYVVHHVLSGTEAIGLLESRREISGLVTDINLGPGPNGWEVAVIAREIAPELPVVYMSGDSAYEHTSRGVPHSVMLQKPFATAQVVTAISSLLNSRPPIPPHARG